MENSENPTPQEKKTLDDSLKLAIREEIEKEVEKRIQKQEGFYWKFLALFGGFVAVFAFALWHVQLSELPGVVQKELATEAVMQAKDRIMEIKSSAEAANQNLNDTSAAVSNILASVNANQETFTNRLNEIKQQDNVLLMGDLSKLFISETITNLGDWKIILSYAPIPQTIRISLNNSSGSGDAFYPITSYASIDKNIITFTNKAISSLEPEKSGIKFFYVQYMRKSLH